MAVLNLSTALQEQLSCSICLSVYTEPKTLQCLHSFCLPCLKEMALKTPQEIPLRCPDCQENIILPPGATFDVLPNSFYFNRLLELLAIQESHQASIHCGSCERNLSLVSFCFECGHFLCSECTNAHKLLGKVLKGHRCVALEKFKDEDMHDLLERPKNCSIEYHDQEKLEYFCDDCQSCICQKCVLLEHRLHRFEPIKKAVDKCKAAIAEVVIKVKAKVPLVQKEIQEADRTFATNEKEIETATDQVNEQVEHLIQLLKDHKAKIISELKDAETSEKERYEKERHCLEGQLAQLNGGVEYVDALVKRDLTAEIINTYKSIIKRCTELEVANVNGNERGKTKIQYVASKEFDVTTAQLTLGRVLLRGAKLDPALSTCEGEGLREAEVGVQTQFVVKTRNSQGDISHSESDPVCVTIKSNAGEVVESTMRDQENGHYTVQYTPKNVGGYEIAVLVTGHPVPGCPFDVRVSEKELKPIKVFGCEGSGAGQLQCPWGIAVNSRGDVAVADKRNNRIQLFTSGGRYLRGIGSKGNANGEFNGPKGVAFDQHGRIVVVDGNNHRIQILTATGKFVTTFGEEELINPHGVCVTSDGKIAVSSGGGKGGVKVFTQDGQLIMQFNDCKRESRPMGITFSGNKFFVSYTYDHGVSVFNREGTFLYSFGKHGQGDGEFDRPHGMVLDRNRVLICDLANHRIQTFTLGGQFVKEAGTKGVQLGQFGEPLDIASGPSGQLYVSEWSGNRVHVFQYQ